MKIIATVLLVIGLPVALFGQHAAKGVVLDENQEPLPGVEVYIEELHIGTTSDFEGNYVLKNIPKGTHKLQFSFIGYSTFNSTIEIISQNINLDVSLTPSLFHMDEVIVSAPFNKLQSENVMKIESSSRRTSTPITSSLSNTSPTSEIQNAPWTNTPRKSSWEERTPLQCTTRARIPSSPLL